MSEALEIRPTSVPLCGPADTMELIGSACGTGRHAGRLEWIYVVVHRRYGLWTHVYDVVRPPGYRGTEIRLIRVMAGDRRAEARAWVLAVKGGVLAGQATVPDKSLYGRGLVWCGPGHSVNRDGHRAIGDGAGMPKSLPVTQVSHAGRRRFHKCPSRVLGGDPLE